MDGDRRQIEVAQVMTSPVVTVTPGTGFQELVGKMAASQVSGIPVVDDEGRLIGIVTESDLLREGSHDRRRTRALDWFLHPGRTEDARARGHDAEAIMTTPVVTVHPDQSIWEAIRTLRDARVKRLPVVDEDGRLVGIVSRVDLLSAFIRTDEEIAEQVRSFASKVLSTDLRSIDAEVHEGRVVLRGSLDFSAQRDVLLEMIRHIPGVLEVEDRLEVGPEGGRGVPFAPIQPPGEAGPRADL